MNRAIHKQLGLAQ